MATVNYVGAAPTVAQVDTITVGSHANGETFVATTGNGKSVTYTAGAAETDATVTAALLTLLQDSEEPEFTEITFDEGATSAKITATGPDDGRPVTLSVSGTGTISLAHTATPSSPEDASIARNYSGNALPSGSDTLVVENTAVSIKWNLDALAAIAVTFFRRETHTGAIGLPSTSEAGYPEYRQTGFDVKSAAMVIEQSPNDQAFSVRIRNVTTGAATAVNVKGLQPGQLGSEFLELQGLPASSTVHVGGGSVALAPFAGQVATVATLSAEDATIRCGTGVTLTTANLKNCNAALLCSYTTLNQSVGGSTEVNGSAAGTNTNAFKGTVSWRSTGSPGTPVVGNGGVLDFSQAPAGVSLGGTVELNAGSSFLDPAGRLATGYAVKFYKCTPADVSFDPGPNKTATIA